MGIERARSFGRTIEWTDLQCVLAVDNIRSVGGKSDVTAQIRYFLCSRPADDETLAEAIRRHWSIENGLRWVLDVTFDKDRGRVRERTAARNWATVRKIALNLLKSAAETRTSGRGRHKRSPQEDRQGRRLHGSAPYQRLYALALREAFLHERSDKSPVPVFGLASLLRLTL